MDRVSVNVNDIINASYSLNKVIKTTPLQHNELLSERYGCNVFLKREDLQVVRSFKIRGAYYLMQSLSEEERAKGVVCASAGNHAQGVAYSCKLLGIRGAIFMPATTPQQKISQVKLYGGPHIEVILQGDTFDDSFARAQAYCEENDMVFVHPFDDVRTIIGQGTLGMEMMNQLEGQIDFVFASIGGGGLCAGLGAYMKQVKPSMRLIGAEPEGAAGMKASFDAGHVVALEAIDVFVDGAAVKQVGALAYELCKRYLDEIALVPEGKECTTILELYNNNAIVIEPAGALPIAALDQYKEEIRGKNVVCVVSGGNNDIDRMQEIKERSLIYEGLKHYFIVNFPQRAGALREFLAKVLGPNDDITRFEYTKKNNRDNGPALVGIELKDRNDYQGLLERMNANGYSYIEINKDRNLFNLLV